VRAAAICVLKAKTVERGSVFSREIKGRGAGGKKEHLFVVARANADDAQQEMRDGWYRGVGPG
jgi:hypothetical protein